MSLPTLAQFRTALQLTRREFPDALTLPGAAYTSPEVYAIEQRSLFGRSWLCVGHVSQWPKPGDFSVLDVAGDSVLLLRAQDGILRAHYNVCRHRGSRLVLEASGHGLARLLCPYHAWSYRLDGTLEVGSEHRRFDGDRSQVRAASVLHALHGLLQRSQAAP